MTTRDKVTFPLIALLMSCLLMGQTCGMDLDPNMNQNQNENDNENSNTEPVARIYGDGSAGSKVVSGDENWNSAENRQTNLQFTDLIIEEGVTLMIPSGMTIRCKGKFENKGTLLVRHGAEGGFAGLDDPNGPDLAFVATPPALGVATRSAQQGETGSSAGALRAGAGAAGLSEFEARVILAPTTNAGSGAAGGLDTDSNTGISSNEGADGGGSVVIIAQLGIVNDGTILAEGQDGNTDSGVDLGGGGGGGIVILASTTSVTNNGTISTSGGDGADSDSNNGPSGGGGGGIIHMIAPEITNNGDAISEGGAAGANTDPITDDSTRFAGGGGGSGGGAGGRGGSIPAGSGPVTAGSATAGSAGFVFMSEQDPQSILK